MNGTPQNHEVVTSSSCSFTTQNSSNNFHNSSVKKMPRKTNREMVGGCCVCSDERGWDENPLVYCDGQGCSVAVHQGKRVLYNKFSKKIVKSRCWLDYSAEIGTLDCNSTNF